MSDHNYNSIEDRGWNQMRFLLDKELPVQEKKRPILFWFFFSGVVIALIAIIAFIILPNTFKEEIVADKTKVAVIDKKSNSNKTPVNKEEGLISTKLNSELKSKFANKKSHRIDYKEDVNNSVTQIINTKDIEHLIKTNITTSSSTQELKKKIEESYNKAQDSATRIEQNTSDITHDIIKNGDKKQALSQLFVDFDRANESSDITTILPLAENEIKKRFMINPLLKIESLFSTPLNAKDKIRPIRKPGLRIPGINSFSPYLLIATNYQSQSPGYGYGIGVGLSYGNDNFATYFESSYMKSKFNGGASSELSRDVAANEIEADAGEINLSPIIGVTVSTFSELTTSADELRIRMGIRKKLMGKFKMDIGLAYSKLIRASNSTLISGQDPASGIPERNFYSVSSSELFDSGAYSSYDIIPHFGLEYTLTSNLYFNLHYNFGLRNLIGSTELDAFSSLSSNDEIYRRNIGVNIRYEF